MTMPVVDLLLWPVTFPAEAILRAIEEGAGGMSQEEILQLLEALEAEQAAGTLPPEEAEARAAELLAMLSQRRREP